MRPHGHPELGLVAAAWCWLLAVATLAVLR